MKTRLIATLIFMGALLAIPALIPSELPAGEGAISMRGVHPNPFTTSTTFQLSMPRNADILIAVHDIVGKHVRTLYEGHHEQGTYPIFWDGKDVTGNPVIPGIYICSLFSENSFVTSVKVVKVQG
jgi:flagellar hook assembly protein FlgD